MPPPKYWSPERDAIIAHDWPLDVPTPDMKAKIDPLPPFVDVPLQEIRTRAKKLRVLRSPEHIRSEAIKRFVEHPPKWIWTPEQVHALALGREANLPHADLLALVNSVPGQKRNAKAMRRQLRTRWGEVPQPKPVVEEPKAVFVAPPLAVAAPEPAPIPRKVYRAPKPIDPAPYAGTRRVSRAVGFSMLGRRAA